MTPDERLVTEVELREQVALAAWALAREAACSWWMFWRRSALRRKAAVHFVHADDLAELLLIDARTREAARG